MSPIFTENVSGATETGLYYLQSRYYNPGWGRFINVDSQYISMDGEAAIAVLVFIGSGQWIPGKMPLQPSVLG